MRDSRSIRVDEELTQRTNNTLVSAFRQMKNDLSGTNCASVKGKVP